jgi:hypothetical protein
MYLLRFPHSFKTIRLTNLMTLLTNVRPESSRLAHAPQSDYALDSYRKMVPPFLLKFTTRQHQSTHPISSGKSLLILSSSLHFFFLSPRFSIPFKILTDIHNHGNLQLSPATIPTGCADPSFNFNLIHPDRSVDRLSPSVPQHLPIRTQHRRNPLNPPRCRRTALQSIRLQTAQRALEARQPEATRGSSQRQGRQPPTPEMGER